MQYRNLTKFQKIITKGTLMATGVVLSLGMISMPVHATGENGDPGAQVVVDETPAEPEPIRVTIYETYNSSYSMFEESMGDMFFFYSNVGNGAFSEKPVKLDIPSNISYVLEKDGAEIAYKSGDEVKAVGNYVLRLSAEYSGDIYEATYRFSIREATSQPSDNTESTVDITDDADDFDMSDLTLDMDESISQEEIDAMVESAGEGFVDAEGVSTEYMDGSDVSHYTGYNQQFEGGTYTISLKSGETIISNVPNGAIVNSGVSIDVPSTITTTVYKDGAEYKQGTLNFHEEGFYTIWFYSSTVDFERFYPTGSVYPHITFRIVNHAVNDMSVFNAPEGCTIKTVDLGGLIYRDSEGNRYYDVTSFWMDKEGTYNFAVYEPKADATYNVTIVRDLTSPDIDITLARGIAYVSVKSNDVKEISLSCDGRWIGYNGGNIEGNGSYVLQATDYAGNVATYTFDVTGGISRGTALRIVIYIMLMIAAVVFLRYKHVSMKVR